MSQPEQVGLRAGFVSRVSAAAVDFIVVTAVYFGMLFGYAVLRFLLRNATLSLPRPHVAVTATLWSLLAIAYLVAIYLLRAFDAEEWRLARHGLLARVRR